MPDDDLIDLRELPKPGRLERHALATVRRRGRVGFVIVTTCVAIAISVLLSVIIVALAAVAPERHDWIAALSVAAGVPAVAVPIFTYQVGRLIQRLDAMSTNMRRLSATDPLTLVLNRRGFFDMAQRAATPTETAVVIVDLDRFKQLNDARGHGFGDEALIHVSKWLNDAVGPAGTVGRLGGDEFVAVGPAPKIDAIPNRSSFVLDGTEFTASVGVTRWTADEPLESALARADVALYRHKVDRDL